MKDKIPLRSLVGGISQQPSAMRLPSQCGDGTKNFIGTVVEGLFKRPAMQHNGLLTTGDKFNISDLTGASNGSIAHHLLNRNDDELYQIMVRGQTGDAEMRVFDIQKSTRLTTPIAGSTIYNRSGNAASSTDFNYLESSDPDQDIRFLSLADYTMVLNRSKVTRMKATRTSTGAKRAVIRFFRGEHSMSYRIRMDWNDNATTNPQKWVAAEYTTYGADSKSPNFVTSGDWKATAKSLTPDEIAKGIQWSLENKVLSLWSSSTSPSTALGSEFGRLWRSSFPTDQETGGEFKMWVKNGHLFIENQQGRDFSVQIEENGEGRDQAEIMKDEVQTFNDLLTNAFDGQVIKVLGDDDRAAPYYVKFSVEDNQSIWAYGTGKWNEAPAEDVEYLVNENTMPHALIRLGYSGTGTAPDPAFLWTPLDGSLVAISSFDTVRVPRWGERVAGDEEGEANPPFIDKTIRGMFFWKDRMGLLSKDQVSLSESGEYFNHFRTTLQQLLESSRIRTGAGDNRVVNLEHAVPVSEHLVLFGEDAQFVIRGDRALTPQSVSVNAASTIDVSARCAPVTMGSTLMAAADHRSDKAAILEISDQSTEERTRLMPLELTKVCPALIPSGVRHMTVSTTETMAVVQSADSFQMYLFTWFDNGNERIQSGWWRIGAPALSLIRHAEFVQDRLFLVMEHPTVSGGTPEWQITSEVIDLSPVQAVDNSRDPLKLDRYVTPTSIALDSATLTATVTLPYEIFSPTLDSLYDFRDESTGYSFEITDTNVGGDRAVFKCKYRDDLQPTTAFARFGIQIQAEYEFSTPHIRDQNGAAVPAVNPNLKMFSILFDRTAEFDVVTWNRQLERVQAIQESDKSRSKFTAQIPGSWTRFTLPLKTGEFRTLIGNHADDVAIRLENNTPFPSKFLGADFEVSYHGRYRRR